MCSKEHFELKNDLSNISGGWPKKFQSTGGTFWKTCRKGIVCVQMKILEELFWKNLLILLHIEQKCFAVSRIFFGTFLNTAFNISMGKIWGSFYLLETINCFYHFCVLSKNNSCFRQKYYNRVVKTDLLVARGTFWGKVFLLELLFFLFSGHWVNKLKTFVNYFSFAGFIITAFKMSTETFWWKKLFLNKNFWSPLDIERKKLGLSRFF